MGFKQIKDGVAELYDYEKSLYGNGLSIFQKMCSNTQNKLIRYTL